MNWQSKPVSVSHLCSLLNTNISPSCSPPSPHVHEESDELYPFFLWSLNNSVGGSLAIPHIPIELLVEFIHPLNPPQIIQIAFHILNRGWHLGYSVGGEPQGKVFVATGNLRLTPAWPAEGVTDSTEVVEMAEARIDIHKIALHSDMPQARIIWLLYHTSINLSMRYTSRMPGSCHDCRYKTWSPGSHYCIVQRAGSTHHTKVLQSNIMSSC